jgi:O-antigen ligase
VSRAAAVVIAATWLLVAWGAFAFGAVYPWAYGPLAIASAVVGIAGFATGDRPVWRTNRLLMVALGGIALVGLLQLVPLPLPTLSAVSGGTVGFLSQYDFRFVALGDPTGDASVSAVRHAISIAPDRTIVFLGLLTAAVLLLTGLLRTLSRSGAVRLARGIVFIGFALALVGIVQKAALGDDAWSGMRIYGFWQPEFRLVTPFGPFVNRNHFAGWMLMGIPIAMSLAMAQWQRAHGAMRYGARGLMVWLSEPDGGRMMLYLVAALIMTLSLLMTGSRSGLGCFTIAMIAAAVLTQRGRSTVAAAAFSLAVVIFVGIALAWAGRDATALERIASDRGSVQLRLDVWHVAGSIVRDFPVFGTGMNTFGTATVLYKLPGSDMHFNEAHNDYVQLLVEGGIVTLALVFLALAGIASGAIRRLRDESDGPEAHWIRVGAVTGIVAMAVQSLVEFSLQMPGNAVLFVVLLALALYVPAPHATTTTNS